MLELYVTTGLEFYAIGMRRKAAFFLRRAALCQIQLGLYGLAGKLLLQIAGTYRLHKLAEWLAADIHSGVTVAAKDATMMPATAVDGWPMLQAMVIRDVMYTFMKLGDPDRKARVVAYFCERIKVAEARAMLPGLLLEVSKSPLTAIVPQGLTGVPVLLDLMPQPLPAERLPLRDPIQTGSDSSTGPFIVSSLRHTRTKARATTLTWVAGEEAVVKVLVSNPLPIQVDIESIALFSNVGGIASLPVTGLFLKPHQGWHVLELCCTPLTAGPLILNGCVTRAFNVESLHWLRCPAIEVLPPEPQLTVRATCGGAAVRDGATVNTLAGEQKTLIVFVENIGVLPIAGIKLGFAVLPRDNDSAGPESPPLSNAHQAPESVELVLNADRGSRGSAEAEMNAVQVTLYVDARELYGMLPLQPGRSAKVAIKFKTCDVRFTGLRLTAEYSKHCRATTADTHVDESNTGLMHRALDFAMPVAVAKSLTCGEFKFGRYVPLQFSALAQQNGDAETSVHTLPITLDMVPTEAASSDYFVLGFGVRNETEEAHSVSVQCAGSAVRNFVLQGFCISSLQIILPKSIAAAAIEESGHQLKVQGLREAIQKYVTLIWTCGTKTGSVPVRLTSVVTSADAEAVLPTGFAIQHRVRSQPHGESDADNAVIVTRGSTLELELLVVNTGTCAATPPALSILPLQKCDSGSLFPAAPLSLRVIGAQVQGVPELEKGGIFRHIVGLHCLATGSYHVSYGCGMSSLAHSETATAKTRLVWGQPISVTVVRQ